MKISRISIKNFKNFEIETDDQIIIIGENKVGKSNLLFALRLILDPSLPDTARELKESDFWNGIEDSVENNVRINPEITKSKLLDIVQKATKQFRTWKEAI